VGFVVDIVSLAQIFSENLGFPCQSFHRLFHTHHHPSSGARTIGQTVADVPSGLSVTPPQGENNKKENPDVRYCIHEQLTNERNF
jgi:hypothetical protein